MHREAERLDRDALERGPLDHGLARRAGEVGAVRAEADEQMGLARRACPSRRPRRAATTPGPWRRRSCRAPGRRRTGASARGSRASRPRRSAPRGPGRRGRRAGPGRPRRRSARSSDRRRPGGRQVGRGLAEGQVGPDLERPGAPGSPSVDRDGDVDRPGRGDVRPDLGRDERDARVQVGRRPTKPGPRGEPDRAGLEVGGRTGPRTVQRPQVGSSLGEVEPSSASASRSSRPETPRTTIGGRPSWSIVTSPSLISMSGRAAVAADSPANGPLVSRSPFRSKRSRSFGPSIVEPRRGEPARSAGRPSERSVVDPIGRQPLGGVGPGPFAEGQAVDPRRTGPSHQPSNARPAVELGPELAREQRRGRPRPGRPGPTSTATTRTIAPPTCPTSGRFHPGRPPGLVPVEPLGAIVGSGVPSICT